MTRRVVVTGYGAVSPLGNTVEELWDQIKAGKSGIKRIDSEEFSGINTQIGGYITDFDAELYFNKKERGRYDLFLQYGYAASMQALEQSGLDLDSVNKERMGIYIGSGIGGMNTLLDKHHAFLDDISRGQLSCMDQMR